MDKVIRAVLIAGAMIAAVPGHAQSWEPTGNVEIISPAGAGGALDRTARLIQKIIQERKLLTATTSVVNKPGGGDFIGYSYLNQHPGSGDYILITSTNLVSNHITGISRIGFKDVTPIALLYTEYPVFSVAVDSPIKDVKDLLAALRLHPQELSVAAATSRTGANAIVLALTTKAVGSDPRRVKMVTYKSSAISAMQMMGGHVKAAVTTPGIVIPLIKGGKVRPLAVAAPERLGGVFADVPTLKELGLDVVVGNWRIVIGPKGLSPDQVSYWNRTIAKVVDTTEWKEQLRRVEAVSDYLDPRKTRQFLEQQDHLFRGTFEDLGIVEKGGHS